MNWRAMLEHYLDDHSEDCNLQLEAIASIEKLMGHMDMNELMHYSKPLAIAYLALTDERMHWNEPQDGGEQ